jgi:hypothetical protein
MIQFAKYRCSRVNRYENNTMGKSAASDFFSSGHWFFLFHRVDEGALPEAVSGIPVQFMACRKLFFALQSGIPVQGCTILTRKPGTPAGSPATHTTGVGTLAGSPATLTTSIGTLAGSPATHTTSIGTLAGSPATLATGVGIPAGSPATTCAVVARRGDEATRAASLRTAMAIYKQQ